MNLENEVEILIEIYHQMQLNKLCVPEFDNQDTMKLLLCRNCRHIFNLSRELRTCECGKSSGKYIDTANAEYYGEDAVPLGMGNGGLVNAIKMATIENKHQKEPTTCQGVDFKAFVILDCSTTIKKK